MYAKIVNEQTKECQVGTGTDVSFYQRIGMTEMEVEQAYNGVWYLKGYAPQKPARQRLEEQIATLEGQTGLIRPLRENILAEGSAYSDYVKQKAREIEDLAQELRNL